MPTVQRNKTRVPPESIPTMGFEPSVRDPRYVKICCPKCRSRSLVMTEIWETSIQWIVKDGWMEKAGGALNEGTPTCVEAKCQDCGHGWTARGASQILDVLEDD